MTIRIFICKGITRYTHLISKITFSTLSSFKSRSLVILLVWKTQFSLFYFLNFGYIRHRVYVSKLFPSRQWWVINIMFSILSHESACVILCQWFFFVFLLWLYDITLYIYIYIYIYIYYLYFYLSFRSSSLVSKYNFRFSYFLFLNTSSQHLKCISIILTSPHNRISLQNDVIFVTFP